MSKTRDTTHAIRWDSRAVIRLTLSLLLFEVAMVLLEQFRWFPKGWIALAVVAIASAGLIYMLLRPLLALLLRRRWHFYNQSLLLLIPLFAFPCSWLIMEISWAKRQQVIVRAIEKAGGNVYFDYQCGDDAGWLTGVSPKEPLWLRRLLTDGFFHSVYVAFPERLNDGEAAELAELTELRTLFVNSTGVTDVGLRIVKRLHYLEAVNISDTEITDAGLEHFKELSHLRILRAGRITISDIGLQHIQGLTKLQELDLSGTRIRGIGLRYLKGLKELEDLRLSNTQVGDAELENLKDMTQLRRLDLQGTRISDDGLRWLTKMSSLQRLNLNGTAISDDGLKHLTCLTQLVAVELFSTKATEGGIKDFGRQFPDVYLNH